MFGYLNTQDLNTFLDRSIVMYDGAIGYVRTDGSVDGETVMFYPLGRGSSAATSIKITDDKFSCRNIDLGYMQHGSRCVYIQRLPMRVFKQGLVRNHLKFTPNDIDRDGIYTPAFADCIRGKHMSFNTAMRKIESATEPQYDYSYAFSRHFCLERTSDGMLFIKHMAKRVASKYGTGDWKIIANGPFSSRLVTMIKEAGGPDVVL